MIFEDIIKEGYKYMVKNIMGGVVAIALAFGASTNITTTHANLQHKSEKLIQASDSTTLSERHAKVEFTQKKDIKKIASSYNLKKTDDIKKIIYIPINDYSVNDIDGQKDIVSVETRLASYSIKKQGFHDQAVYKESFKTTDKEMTLSKKVFCSSNFSNKKSIAGGDSALDSCLKSAYGISATKGFKVNDALEITDNDSANISLYVLERSYDYQLWESDLSQDVPSDSYLGAGTVTRPLGMVIMITS